MLSALDLERLIAVKRREIEKEKTLLGLSPPEAEYNIESSKQNVTSKEPNEIHFSNSVIHCESNDAISQNKKENDADTSRREEGKENTSHRDLEEDIPPDLERYIRRYIGLPVMLKAGEYSPNNPLVRTERSTGDVLLGLGEYERRRNTLRKIRQQQYREYLDQQAKKKQEAKEQAERERREREQKEREQEERERERELLERERNPRSPERRLTSVSYANNNVYCTNKVDTGVQVDSIRSPLSVAVQTDESDFFQLPPSPSKKLTQAERELSPRTVADPHDERRIQPLPWDDTKWKPDVEPRRRSYGDFYERTSTLSKRPTRERLTSDLRHTYMPSIFDADAIQMRNLQAEKEAAERRQYYQQELKNQILEQQRIREERKTREKMLEQAEMRRLEEQLRMLQVAQEKEMLKQRDITAAIKDDVIEYTKKRTELQKEIDNKQKSLLRASTHPPCPRNTTSRCDNISKLPFYYPPINERSNDITHRKPYSTNIPDNSIFSPNYDVDGYLRRNLNFKDNSNRFEKVKNDSLKNIDIDSIGDLKERDKNYKISGEYNKERDRNVIVEKAIVHEPKDRTRKESFDDTLPIPVLRHSPLNQTDKVENDNLSDAMKIVDDKWKVPAVQKNILRSLPNEEGKNVSILTQLGSIRRQLQLEQLKLDKMNKEDNVT